MNNISLFIICCFLIVFIYGCKSEPGIIEEKGELTIDIGIVDKVEFPNNLIKEVTYLKLETNNECLIKQIDKIKFKNELIYIMDRLSKSIFVFNLEGKYIKKYYHYGKGPGEYFNLGDFDISRDGKFIYILDYTQYKICKYSLENNFIKEIKLDFGTSSFSCIDDKMLVFYQKNRLNQKKGIFNNNIVYLDIEKNKPLIGYFPLTDYRMVIGNYAIYSSDDKYDQLFYLPFSTSGVYKINKDGVIPFINFLGVNPIEEKIWAISNPKEFMHRILESNYHINFRDFYILDSIISFAFSQDKINYKIFYSLKTNKMIFGSGFLYSSPHRLPGRFNIIGTFKDDFVSYFFPLDIMKQSYDIFPFYKKHIELHEELIEVSKKTSIHDNPIIVFFQINIE
jgi:hypothetical protein